ncbi:MAG: SprB repeat-containing protein, partial [Prevotellaceae bacterium]|nr:SprB repeat-containing protein [Prevotellaceae bacterium]
MSVTNPKCNGGTDGSVAVTVSGGTAPYTYAWKRNNSATGTNSANISGLSAGNISVKVTDKNGCYVDKSAAIGQPALLTAQSSVALPSAHNASDGKITITPSGGTSPYTYKWDNNSTANPRTGVSARDNPYTVTVTDAKGCTTAINDIYVIYPVSIRINADKTVSCNGGNDAKLTAAVTGGTSSRTYKWYRRTGNTSSVISGATASTMNNVAAGVYYAVVTDSRNVTKTSEDITLSEPAQLKLASSIVKPTAHNSSDGKITITATGGTYPYSYKWQYNNLTANPLTGIPASNTPYRVTVTDAKGCIETLDVELIYDLGVEITVTAPVLCYGGTGTLSAIATGGVSTNYQYEWFEINAAGNKIYPSLSSSSVLPGRKTGKYSVKVTDAKSAVAESKIFELSQPAQLSASSNITQPAAHNASDGKITVTPSGGTSPYTYKWDNNSTTSTLTGVSARDEPYEVTVRDANGCITTLDDIYVVYYPMEATIVEDSKISCYGRNDGKLRVTVTGGAAGKTYRWYSKNAAGDFVRINGVSGSALNGVATGIYRVEVTDGRNVTALAGEFEIQQPALLTAEAFIIEPSQYDASDGQIKIEPSGGTPPYSYQWVHNGSTVNPLANVPAMDEPYMVKVSDVNGCSTALDDISVIYYPMEADIVAEKEIACFGGFGNLKAVVRGGKSNKIYHWYFLNADNNFEYISEGAMLQNAGKGTYRVRVKDENDTTAYGNFDFLQPVQLSATCEIGLTSAYNASDGKIKVLALGGTLPYSYAWDGYSSTADSLTGIPARDNPYTVTVSDAKGCKVVLNPRIIHPLAVELKIADSIPCFGAAGSLQAKATGGVGTDYLYKWYKINEDYYNYEEEIASGKSGYIDNLTTGKYMVRAIDLENNHEKSLAVDIPQPTLLVAKDTIFLPSAHNASNGKIEIKVSGGTAPYSCTMDNQTTTNPITGIPARDNPYQITVTDAKGCSVELKPRMIYPLSVEIAVNDSIDCYGGTGTLKATAVGGVGKDYSYRWYKVDDGISRFLPAEGNILTNVLQGIYRAEAIDVENNVETSENLTVAQPSQLTAEYAIFTPSAHDAANGTITVTASGGTPPYSHTLDNKAVTNPLAGIPARDNPYSVIVRDAKGCSVELNPRVIFPLTVAVSIKDSIPCYDGTGTLEVAAVGGVGTDYSYKWYMINEDSNYEEEISSGKSSTVNNVFTGKYFVKATDIENNTQTSNIINLPQPELLTAEYTIDLPGAYNASDGQITIRADGGTAPYSYALDNNVVSNPLTGISANDVPYTATVSDSKGCIATLYPRVIYPLAVEIAVTDSISCYLGSDGTLAAVATGGVGSDYSYSWYKVEYGRNIPFAATGNILANVESGIYYVEVKDVENNVSKSGNFEFNHPEQLKIDHDVVLTSSADASDGEIAVTVSGGIPGYTYLWDYNGQTGNRLSGLPSGHTFYNLTVTDHRGCTETLSTRLVYPLKASILIEDSISCYGRADGRLKATAKGGVQPNYEFQWYRIDKNQEILITGASESELSNVNAGIYRIKVYCYDDAIADYIATSSDITFNSPDLLSVSSIVSLPSAYDASDGAVTLNVNGGTPVYSYSWNFSNSGKRTLTDIPASDLPYTVTVTDVRGCSETVYPRVIYPLEVKIAVVDSISCYGRNDGILQAIATGGAGKNYKYQWCRIENEVDGILSDENSDILSNVGEGIYKVEVTDIENNKSSSILIFNQPALLTAKHDYLKNPLDCKYDTDGSVQILIKGGTKPYFCLWSDGNTEMLNSSLPEGVHTYVITDNRGCTDNDEVQISSPGELTPGISHVEPKAFNSADASVSVEAKGGTAPYEYVWNDRNQTAASLNGVTHGIYTVIVTDANGCTKEITDTVHNPPLL